MKQLMNNLGRPMPMKDDNIGYRSYFQKHGFMIRFQEISEDVINAANNQNMKENFRNTNNRMVFKRRKVRISYAMVLNALSL